MIIMLESLRGLCYNRFVALGTCVDPAQFGDIVVKSDGSASFMGMSAVKKCKKLIEEAGQYY